MDKLNRCLCGCYVDHYSDLTLKNCQVNDLVFLYLRQINHGPFGDKHYTKEECIIVHYLRDGKMFYKAIDKYYKPKLANKKNSYRTDLEYIYVDLDQGEQLIYENK